MRRDTPTRLPENWRILVWLLAVVALLGLVPSPAIAEEGGCRGTWESQEEALGQTCVLSPQAAVPAAQDETATLTAITDIAWTLKYGNIILSLGADELEAAFDYGDVLEVSFLGTTIQVPMCSSYSDVDAGVAGIFTRQDYVILAITDGDFATSYGLGVKTILPDGSFQWDYAPGVEGPIEFTITLYDKGGYLYEYLLRHLEYSNEREDYLELADDQFANFRVVSTTGMGENVLYRSSSPIDPARGRNAYADVAASRVGVDVVLNLADAKVEALQFEGYDQTYYATVPHVAFLSMDNAYAGDEFREKLAQGLRLMAQTPGTYLVHCLEGKDRTGFVVAVLECLMGASADEVLSDYMVSFYNFYGVKADEERYGVFSAAFASTLTQAFGVDDLALADLSAEAEEYLLEIGLTADEVRSLKAHLNPQPTSHVVSFDVGGHGTAPTAQLVEEGACAVRPADPVTEGLVFVGWYRDVTDAVAYDFGSAVTEELTLHARWAEAHKQPDEGGTTDTPAAPQNSAESSQAQGSGMRATTALANATSTLPRTGDASQLVSAFLLASLGSLLAGVAARLRRA